MFETLLSGLGYSGYAVIAGIPIPLLPGNATENENVIKSSGSYHYDPRVSIGQLPAKNRRSLPLSFSTFICPRTMPLVKVLTYGWRTLDLMDMVGETQFSLFPAVGEGYTGFGYVDELTIAGSPESLVSLNINMTSWVWTEIPSQQSLQKYGAALSPMSDVYKPTPGWATIPYFPVISNNAIPMNWSLNVNNNWSYQAFLGGYTQPPNPALITAGDLDVTFNITWLAARNSRPLDVGSLELQIGVPQIDRIFIDNLIRDPQRAFTGIAGPNEPIKWRRVIMPKVVSPDQTDKKPEVERKRFRFKLYLRIMANKTLRPVVRKELATLDFIVECEYPTYEEELEAKKQATTYDEVRGIHYVDNDQISEWRVKRCLIKWNLHRKLQNFCRRLRRMNNMLTSESWADFKKLPPLVRKQIVNKLWQSLGAP